jgi:hypothetical protein
LDVVIAMIAKPFSLNKHSNQNTRKRYTGSIERRADASDKEIVRICEETVRTCAFIFSHGEHTCTE